MMMEACPSLPQAGLPPIAAERKAAQTACPTSPKARARYRDRQGETPRERFGPPASYPPALPPPFRKVAIVRPVGPNPIRAARRGVARVGRTFSRRVSLI